MDSKEIEDFISTSDSYQGILLEYCALASLPKLSEAQAEYLDRILAQAETDEVLNFLLIEFDHILAKKLNLLDDAHIAQYEDQQAYLREHLVQLTPEDLDYYRELQKLLRDKGCYCGLVDGVFTKDSREAVEQFQETEDIAPDGNLTPETVLRLVSTADDALRLTRSRSPDSR